MKGLEEIVIDLDGENKKAPDLDGENTKAPDLDEENNNVVSDAEVYPLRPSEMDCLRYLRTGVCVYGPFCMFNHPRSRVKALREAEMLQVAINLPRECKFYLSPKGCKYGDDCRYGHYREKSDIELMGYYHGKRNMRYNRERCNSPQTSNYGEVMRGLPSFASFCENMEEKVCPFYLLHGFCRFLPLCKFFHPPSTPEAGRETLSGNSQQRLDELVSFSASNQPNMYTEYQDLATSSSSEPKADYGPHLPNYGTAMSNVDVNLLAKIGESSVSASASFESATNAEPYRTVFEEELIEEFYGPGLGMVASTDGDVSQQSKIEELPEREIQHYQPSIDIAPPTAEILGRTGLPRRLDQPICPCYIRFGLCIKGQGCQYNHPVAGGPPGSDDE